MRGRSAVVLCSVAVTSLAFAAPQVDAACWQYSKADHKLASRIDRARSYHEVHRLTLDPQLSRVAQKHTNGMIDHGYLYHTASETLGDRVTRWRALGEIVGTAASARELHRAFMESSAHKDIILRSNWRYFGVAAEWHKNQLWATIVFESRRDPGTRLKMPSC